MGDKETLSGSGCERQDHDGMRGSVLQYDQERLFPDGIAEIVPRTTKADIYGLSLMIKRPLELTQKEYKAVEKEYRKTGEPAVLKKVFG